MIIPLTLAALEDVLTAFTKHRERSGFEGAETCARLLCLGRCLELIEQELAAGEAAWKDANKGKARVCARRDVALAIDAWLARLPVPPWRGDAMEHLRRFQQDATLPDPVRQASERLSTTVTRRHLAPFTTDPIGDARVIIEYLNADTSEGAP